MTDETLFTFTALDLQQVIRWLGGFISGFLFALCLPWQGIGRNRSDPPCNPQVTPQVTPQVYDGLPWQGIGRYRSDPPSDPPSDPASSDQSPLTCRCDFIHSKREKTK